jgi:hypothetical protein
MMKLKLLLLEEEKPFYRHIYYIYEFIPIYQLSVTYTVSYIVFGGEGTSLLPF